MFDQAYKGTELLPDRPIDIRVLDEHEITEISGGFVCGGLCLAGIAFGAGALFGSGVAVGYHSAK